MQTIDPARPWELYSRNQRWFFLGLLFLASLSSYIDKQILSVLLEPIKAEYHASDTQMGLLGGFAFAAFYAIAGLPVARLADRGNRRTVIAVSLAAWSLMTMVCGYARSFPQLFLARIGVGIGEAGAIPPAQSLIADYFPPNQRGRALSLFMLSASGGYLLAMIGGAQLAAHHGWRIAFIALGAPGLLLALICGLGLREPRARSGFAVVRADGEPLRESIAKLSGKRSYVLLCIAFVLYYFFTYGVVTWFPAYLVRVMKLRLTDVGVAYGMISTLVGLASTIAGGILTDRMGARDIRWFARVPGWLMIGSWPFYTVAIATDNFWIFIATASIGGIGLGAGLPAMFTLLHRICGSPRRATALAIAFFFANLLGLGFGPVFVGYLSDLFTATMGPVGLRYALLVALTILLPTGLVLLAIARSLERDCEA